MSSYRVQNKEKFVELYDNGLSLVQIAKECNCCSSTVSKYFQQIGKKIQSKDRWLKSQHRKKKYSAKVGDKYHNLTCTGSKTYNRKTIWCFVCDCGNTKETSSLSSVFIGKIKSCGCLNRRKLDQNPRYMGKYGISYQYIKTMFRRNYQKFNLTELDITIEDLYILYEQQDGKCKLSGLPISFSDDARGIGSSASIDRIDSNKPYTKDNIQWVHKDINYIKSIYDQNYFIDLCKCVSNQNPNL